MQDRTLLTFKVDLPGGEGRLREAISHVCGRCSAAKRFGKIKLNKILWRADFTAFAERRIPVTGWSYLKLAAGPAPTEMAAVLERMQDDQLVAFERRDFGEGYVEERPVSLKAWPRRFLSEDDEGFLEASIRFYWSKTATAASELSHQVAWKSRDFLDPLPYESVLLSDQKPGERDRARFAEIARARRLTSL